MHNQSAVQQSILWSEGGLGWPRPAEAAMETVIITVGCPLKSESDQTSVTRAARLTLFGGQLKSISIWGRGNYRWRKTRLKFTRISRGCFVPAADSPFIFLSCFWAWKLLESVWVMMSGRSWWTEENQHWLRCGAVLTVCLEVRESGLDKFSVGRLPSGQSCDQRLDRRSGGKTKLGAMVSNRLRC